MLTSSGGRSMLTVADRGEDGKICQNLSDVICERSLSGDLCVPVCSSAECSDPIGYLGVHFREATSTNC